MAQPDRDRHRGDNPSFVQFHGGVVRGGLPCIDKVDDAYTARDSCLEWTVVMTDDGTTDSAEMGARVARSCGAEITALVLTTDPNGDPVVARKINADSVFRATGYVIRSRYAASAIAQKR